MISFFIFKFVSTRSGSSLTMILVTLVWHLTSGQLGQRAQNASDDERNMFFCKLLELMMERNDRTLVHIGAHWRGRTERTQLWIGTQRNVDSDALNRWWRIIFYNDFPNWRQMKHSAIPNQTMSKSFWQILQAIYSPWYHPTLCTKAAQIHRD